MATWLYVVIKFIEVFQGSNLFLQNSATDAPLITISLPCRFLHPPSWIHFGWNNGNNLYVIKRNFYCFLLSLSLCLRTGESRERVYDHNTYGHHDRAGSGSFERQRHYEADYYRDARERTLGTSGASGSVTASGSGASASAGSSSGSGSGSSSGAIVSCVVSSSGAGGAAGTTIGSGGSTSSVIGFYRAHSRSPCRFEAPEPRYESSRARESFTLASVVHRDLYRDDRGRRGEHTYRQSRSRSRSTHSRNPSPQRLTGQTAGLVGQTPGLAGQTTVSRSRSSSSDSLSSTSSSTSGR